MENCTLSNCDCGYIIRNKSEDKLVWCFSQPSFVKKIVSCFHGKKVRPIEGIANVTDNYSFNSSAGNYFFFFSNDNYSFNYSTEISSFNLFSKPKGIFIRYFFWIIAVLVITGNAYVIISGVLKTSCFKQAWPSVSLQCNHIVIINIAVADFMMGIYLITISILNVVKFESNNHTHLEWVGSLGCSIVGSLAVISSEASCFLMVTLTSFRLYHVYRPLSSMTASSWSWRVCILTSWFVAVFLGVFPILESNSEYFISFYTVKTSSGYTAIVSKNDIDSITCSLVSLDRSNYSSHEFEKELEYLNKHLSRNAAQDQFNSCLEPYPTYQDFKDHRDDIKQIFSDYFIDPPKGKIGFYGLEDMCLPRPVGYSRTPGWEYSISIITLNFTCFIFIAVSYILIYIRSTKKRPINAASTIDLQKREAEMQKRIARIIITDFACWVPICVLAFLAISSIDSFDCAALVNAVAGFLLPINSALNPFLYSVSLSKLFKKLRCQVLNKCRN